MKSINTYCVLFILLNFNITAYAGVTDGNVTAYRHVPDQEYVYFTNDPEDEPTSNFGPLGAAYFFKIPSVYYECSSATGQSGVAGLTCIGAPDALVADYTCSETAWPVSSDTIWCLFSENPRTGDKAWAVKFVSGIIPTSDGASIVRCEGTDIFDFENGCRRPPSQISIDGGFIKLDTTEGTTPLDADCSLDSHNGRLVVDEWNNFLYICTIQGWKVTTLSSPTPD